MHSKTFIALLRGVNVGGHNRVPMSELRASCEKLGLAGVQTYIQSGNLLLKSDWGALRLEESIERLIERTFALSIPVIVRSAADWTTALRGNPFPEASREEPNAVMLGLSKTTPKQDAANELAARALAGERVKRVGDAIWIHFATGFGRSKLTPQFLDKALGSPVTLRNWRTVLKLDELAKGMTPRGGRAPFSPSGSFI
ncbi:MAG TPA: DUF1697 domain-containing protein [Thermoanaerobaculia bacterium]|nr:DUF1697 domain-containing protein [Thermoanaerobaculia bacterium]